MRRQFLMTIFMIMSLLPLSIMGVNTLIAQTIINPKPLSKIKTNRSDWPDFLGNDRNSKSTEKGIITRWPKNGLRILWQKKIGESYGIGSISGGRFYQFGRYKNKARLTCMDAKTGKDLWKFEYPTNYQDLVGFDNGPRCSPVIDGNRIYLFGVEGMLYCLNLKTQKVVWKVNTTKKFGVVKNFFGVGSTPIIEGNLLIANIGGSPANSPGLYHAVVKGNGTGVVAFNKMTGAVQYKISNELASYSSPMIATINRRRWCFMFARGGLLGFEPKTGKVDFHFPLRSSILESVNASTPIVIDDQVFISECYGPGSALLKVKPGGYQVVWSDKKKRRDKSLQTHWNTPIHINGYVYGCSGRHSNGAELRCIELKTGKIQWSQGRLSRCSLMSVDGHFICLSEVGVLRLLKVNPKKYEELAQFVPRDGLGNALLQYPAWAAPILSDGLLYVRGKNRLVCLELITKKKLPRKK